MSSVPDGKFIAAEIEVLYAQFFEGFIFFWLMSFGKILC